MNVNSVIYLDSNSEYHGGKITTALFTSGTISGAILSNNTVPINKIE